MAGSFNVQLFICTRRIAGRWICHGFGCGWWTLGANVGFMVSFSCFRHALRHWLRNGAVRKSVSSKDSREEKAAKGASTALFLGAVDHLLCTLTVRRWSMSCVHHHVHARSHGVIAIDSFLTCITPDRRAPKTLSHGARARLSQRARLTAKFHFPENGPERL